MAGVSFRLAAQVTTVPLRGFVSAPDPNSSLSARVDVRNLETGASRSVIADSSGAWRVLGLPPGLYSVSVRAVGHRQQRRDSLRLVLGERPRLDFVLERGAVELEPTVVRAERALDVQRADVSKAVLQEEIQNLPLNSRNVMNLAAIVPGMRAFPVEGGRAIPGAGALPAGEGRFTNLYVDGTDWRAVYAPGILGQAQEGSIIPQEALREFRVYMNPYDAEYSHGAAYVVSAVTHRGGNELHGSLFGFHQDRALVARGGFQRIDPPYRRDQIGGHLRGPIAHEKLFFAATYETQITDDFVDVVPPRPSEQADRWIAYAGTFRAPNHLQNGLLRLTAPTGRHMFDLIWMSRDFRREAGYGTYAADGRYLVREAGQGGHSSMNNLVLRDTYSASSLVNELSLHLARLANKQFLLGDGATQRYRTVQIGRINFPFSIDDRHAGLANKTTVTLNGPLGRHVLKGGVEATYVETQVFRPNNSKGFFTFLTDTSTVPTLGSIGVGVPGVPANRQGWSASYAAVLGSYVQDEWQPAQRLTITAGLRYDADVNTQNQKLIATWAYDTTLQRAFGSRFVNTGDRRNDWNNVAPRISASWDVSGRQATFLRAGYGVMYDRVPAFAASAEARELTWRTYSFPSPGTTDPQVLRDRVAAGSGTARPSVILLKDDLQTPVNRQWSVGLGHRLLDRVAINIDYLSQRVEHATVSVLTNKGPNNTRPISTRFGDITLWDDFGDARYRALLTSITYDQPGTRVSVAYTLGYAESEFGEFTLSDYPDASTYVMQRSESDERHRVAVSAMRRLPYGVDISALGIVASPRPFLVFAGNDVNVNGTELDDWPNGIRTDRRHGWAHWFRSLDLRLTKQLASVDVIAELFNVFNTANFSEYQPLQSEVAYAEPAGDFPRRQGQIGARYRF